jgi:transposase
MTTPKEVFVGIDVAKRRHAVAIADAGRDGEIRYMGEFDASPESMTRLIKKLAAKHDKLHFCYEAGPTGYTLYRQIVALGHDCIVVAPSLIPRRPGDRVKTNRRDAQSLARLLRAGELTAVWVPDETHEAIRDLVRTRPWRWRMSGASASTLHHSCFDMGIATTARQAGAASTSAGLTSKASLIPRSGWRFRRC